MNLIEQLRVQRPSTMLYVLTLLALLLAQGQTRSARAQGEWATNGENINNTNTGKVGVGTTAPEQTLHVNGPVLTTGAVAGFNFRNRGSASATDDWVWYSSGNVARFWRGGTDLLSITAEGNIGVGTTNPGGVFDLQRGNSADILQRFWNTGAGGAKLRYVAGPGATSQVQFTDDFEWLSSVASNSQIGLQFRVRASEAANDEATLDSSVRMTIARGGNVGVGTLTPGFRLDVQGGTVNASGGLCIAGDCKTTWAQVSGGSSQWTTNGSNIFYNTGGVGVGTSSPAFQLDVLSSTNAPFRVRDSGGREYFSTTARALSPTLTTPVVSLAGGRLIVEGGGAEGLETLLRRMTPNMVVPHPDTPTGLGVFIVRQKSGAPALYVDQTVFGNVGINTSTPRHKLDVAGEVNGTSLCIARDCKTSWSAVSGQWATNGSNIFYNTGSVGVGTSNPAQRLDVVGNVRATGLCIGDDCKTAWSQVGGGTSSQWTTSGSDIFYTAGKVGIGVTVAREMLDVNGNINVSGNINAKYQDVAEWVPSTQKLSAGTVVVLDAGRTNHVVASGSAYDTRVAGVVSERPGLLLGERGEGKLMVATTGRVRVRVDATRGAIKVGDLLVTSDREGLAMRSEPVKVSGRRMHLPGTLIGKALEPLAGGVGDILVLLSLQ